MFRRYCGWMVVVVALASAATARADETLEEVGRYLDDAVRQYRTVRYKVQVTSEIASTTGERVRGTQEIEHEILRQPNGLALTRYQAHSTGRTQGGGKPERVSETSTLSIFDGRYLYDLRTTTQQVYAVKTRPKHNPYDPIGRLDQVRENFEVRLLPERTFEGQEVYALEFIPKAIDGSTLTHRMVTYMDRKTGLPLRTISYDKGGRVVNTASVVETHLNEDIPAEHFVFHTPPGVKVVDMTKVGGPASQSQPAGAATQTRPAEPRE